MSIRSAAALTGDVWRNRHDPNPPTEPGGAAPWAATIRGMLMFLDDYSEGAHPAVLEALVAHNGGQEFGYGEDRYSRLAAEAGAPVGVGVGPGVGLGVADGDGVGRCV